MKRAACEIRIGTSGWYYDHWRDLFYPDTMPKSRWFEHYARHFDTVEVNNTFYHLPKPETLQKWQRQAPEGFLYTVKANRYITHIKKLKDTCDELNRFFEAVGLLKGKLGPVLYQLPPSLHKDLDLLKTFIDTLPGKPPAVFEFRHASWYEQDTLDLLRRHGADFCTHDMPGRQSPRAVTGNVAYVRFHGPSSRYAGSYAQSQLQEWATWLKEQTKEAHGIYAYFNNDQGAHAVRNAKQLRKHMGLRNMT